MSPRVVLLVDSDEKVRGEVRRCLSERQLTCREASSGSEALELARAEPPDLFLVDLALPDQSGLGLCRTVRESPELAGIPIIVLTGQAGEMDRVLAFESGVDDFLAKPFYPPELGARVSAVLRGFAGSRPAAAPEHPSALDVDAEGGRLWVEGESVDLTPRERALLIALAARAGRVVRRRELIQRLWGLDAPHSERAVDAHIKSIRRKLGRSRRYIETVRGVGYRLSEEALRGGA